MAIETQHISNFFHQFLLERGVEIEFEKLADFNFVESGLLDSFEILSMVMQLEAEFKIKLTPEQLSAKRTATVGGLVTTIVQSMSKDMSSDQ